MPLGQPQQPVPQGLMGQPAGNQPVYQTVDPNSLVSDQLNNITAEGGAYIDAARAAGTQQAASRGLMNGSMSAGASENAAIQAALPIAQANASEYANVGNANQGAYNTYVGQKIAQNTALKTANISAGASRANAQLQFTAAEDQLHQQGSEFTQQLAQNNSQFGQQLAQNNSQFLTQQNTAIGEFQNQMSFNQYQLGTQMQASTNNDYAQSFAAIMNNPNMTAEDRANAIQNSQSFFSQMSQYNATLPAFQPYYASNPDYWSSNWTGP